MTRIIYTPKKGDPVTTDVNGITFEGGFPVEVSQEWLVDKLLCNPWFAEATVEDEVQNRAALTRLTNLIRTRDR
jgi:hypothetical protein